MVCPKLSAWITARPLVESAPAVGHACRSGGAVWALKWILADLLTRKTMQRTSKCIRYIKPKWLINQRPILQPNNVALTVGERTITACVHTRLYRCVRRFGVISPAHAAYPKNCHHGFTRLLGLSAKSAPMAGSSGKDASASLAVPSAMKSSACAPVPRDGGKFISAQISSACSTNTIPLEAYVQSASLIQKVSTMSCPRAKDLRQWDYPYGWPPHQILAWQALKNYGMTDDAEQLAYRWLYTIAKNAHDYNGTIPEKYNVVTGSHDVFVEYGNVGTKFSYIAPEGFGWMNASFEVGLKYLSASRLEDLRRL